MRMLVLVRHGQSLGQVEKGFTGWVDTELTVRGMHQAQRCGEVLRARGFVFDVCYTSVLRRARQTLALALESLAQPTPKVVSSWRLNGRHYGALQERSRAEMIAIHGRQQVQRWRNEYTLRPPKLPDSDPRLPDASALYSGVDPRLLPRAESHADADARIGDYWHAVISEQVRAGLRVLVVSHNSAMRGLVKCIERLRDDQVAKFKLPTARPLVYELDCELRPMCRYSIEPRLPLGLHRLIARRPKPA